MIAQIVNFTIVFLVLYFFALKPLAKVMRERTKKIEKGLTDAKKIEENLAQTKNEYGKKMAIAKKEANEIIEKARLQAEEKKQATIDKAKAEIGQIINEQKEQIQAEKAKTLKEIKKEVASLVIAAAEKVLEQKIDNKEDEKLIKKIVK